MKHLLLIIILFKSIATFAQVPAIAGYAPSVTKTVNYENISYGYLYNFFAVYDSKNIANTGWHIPSLAEWGTLSTYLGGVSVAGAALKESGIIYWTSDNGLNTSCFYARGTGERANSGIFKGLKIYCSFWSSDYFDLTQAKAVYIYNGNDEFDLTYYPYTIRGCGVRLIKDSTTLLNGETSTYTGNDGKIYRTICIGTQEWLSENLAETKYRNGDSIPEVTNNTTWVGLTTGARCVYDNDENNK